MATVNKSGKEKIVISGKLAISGKQRRVVSFKELTYRLPLTAGFCFLLLTAYHLPLAYPVPYHTITVDGDLSEWASDEIVAADKDDSTFDAGTGKNEIQNLYLTWDKENLYLGIEGQVNNNGLLLYLDVDPGGSFGQGNLTKINTWNRRIIFSGAVTLPNGSTAPFLPDFFYGSWDGSNGNFYTFVSSNIVRDISGETSLITSRSSAKPGVEIRLPFKSFYGLGTGRIPSLAKIALVSAIGTGDVGGDVVNGISIGFGFLAGDSAPNNLQGAPLNNFTTSTLNNFSLVELDKNGDGAPDNFFAKFSRLELSRPVANPQVFAPSSAGSVSTTISFTLSLPSSVEAKIFDLNGKLIRRLFNGSVNFLVTPHKVELSWDGKNDLGEIVPMGIYIVNIHATSSAGGARENTAVAVIK